MLHANKTKQLGRKRNQRNALIKSLAVSLVRDGRIKTTETKAKVLRSYIERIITKGKSNDLQAQRLIASYIGPVSAKKVIKEISPKYIDRKGGYTRITKLQSRVSDGAKLAQIEFV